MNMFKHILSLQDSFLRMKAAGQSAPKHTRSKPLTAGKQCASDDADTRGTVRSLADEYLLRARLFCPDMLPVRSTTYFQDPDLTKSYTKFRRL